MALNCLARHEGMPAKIWNLTLETFDQFRGIGSPRWRMMSRNSTLRCPASTMYSTALATSPTSRRPAVPVYPET
jgi:hypothetical protein